MMDDMPEDKPAVALLRADYAKFKIELDVDNHAAINREFQETMQSCQAAMGWDGSWKAGIARVVDKQRRVFFWEVWGEMSEAIVYLPWEGWEEHLERIDIRQEINWSDDGKEELYKYLERNGTGGRMLQKFNKPKRQKVGGRDGGGTGFAVGSHKSEYRLSVYRRGGEAGAIEFQLAGARIERARAQVRQTLDETPDALPGGPWKALQRIMHAGAWYETRVVTQLSKQDVLGIVAGETLAPRDPEQHAQEVLKAVRELPNDVRFQVVRQLQLELMA